MDINNELQASNKAQEKHERLVERCKQFFAWLCVGVVIISMGVWL